MRKHPDQPISKKQRKASRYYNEVVKEERSTRMRMFTARNVSGKTGKEDNGFKHFLNKVAKRFRKEG